jgi:hypothetical protein
MLICSCTGKSDNKKTFFDLGSGYGNSSSGEVEYHDFLRLVKIKKSGLQATDKATSDFLFKTINQGITYYWTGTPWDFNGTTRQPQKGTIACGYFITNVLSDLGFNIQRIKLAQQASSAMIEQLTVDVKRLRSIEELNAYLDAQPINSVFIAGLDFHTGFILKAKDGCYFLHANYINKEGVIKEKIETSAALKSSKSFMIGNLTANTALLDSWIRS